MKATPILSVTELQLIIIINHNHYDTPTATLHDLTACNIDLSTLFYTKNHIRLGQKHQTVKIPKFSYTLWRWQQTTNIYFRKETRSLACTRKLSYCKDDRAMRNGFLQKFRKSLSTPTATFPEFFNGLVCRCTLEYTGQIIWGPYPFLR